MLRRTGCRDCRGRQSETVRLFASPYQRRAGRVIREITMYIGRAQIGQML